MLPAGIAVGLMLVWAVQNGGFDATTWYWGGLLLLGTLAVLLAVQRSGRLRISRAAGIALALFGLYVAWSYLSMTWAQYPGLALQGSNRALVYFLAFALMTVVPWTKRVVRSALLAFAIGVGVIAMVLLIRLAADAHVADLLVGGRLAAPTGYINSTAALFTMQALVAIALAAPRGLPGLMRGLLLALAGAGLQLAIIVQSRGWLFTLPLVALVAVAVIPNRCRVAVAAVVPIAAALIPVRELLRVYESGPGRPLGAAAMHAGRPALMACAGVLLVGTLLAWMDQLIQGPRLSRRRRRAIGGVLAVIAVGGVIVGGMIVSRGHPEQFLARQWSGFSHEQTSSSSSHFTDAGSGRFDFWRVAVDAFAAHPIGGLGQDNFADYYLTHRRTGEEPSWTHSLELRLLAHTGVVGALLFAGFLAAALTAAGRVRRRGDPAERMLAATLLLPLVVWLIHGSVDWFWEMPALTGPALGFLGAAAGLGGRVTASEPRTKARRLRPPVPVVAGAGAGAVLCAAIVLALPYLSQRETARAADIQTNDPARALRDLHLASALNPLSSDPGRLAGAIALRSGRNAIAAARFRQSIAAEPAGWFSWLGLGLAESALHQRAVARRDFVAAARINPRQAAIVEALRRVDTRRPMTTAQAFRLLSVVQ